MKFSDYYLSSGARITALFFGGIAAITVNVLLGWKLGILTGCFVALIASVVVPWMLYRKDLPYTRVKQTLKQPFLFDERVRFTVRGGTVGGFFVLTEQSMIFLSMEKGEHRLELSRSDVQSVTLRQDMTVCIYLNDRQFIRLISGACEEICEVLRQNGWAVTHYDN